MSIDSAAGVLQTQPFLELPHALGVALVQGQRRGQNKTAFGTLGIEFHRARRFLTGFVSLAQAL